MTLDYAGSLQGTLSSIPSTVLTVLGGVSSTALSFLPASVQRAVGSAFVSVQTLLAERWEVRVLAMLLMLPTAAFALFASTLAVALLWPFAFLTATVGGLAVTASYIFWPGQPDWKTSAAHKPTGSQPHRSASHHIGC